MPGTLTLTNHCSELVTSVDEVRNVDLLELKARAQLEIGG